MPRRPAPAPWMHSRTTIPRRQVATQSTLFTSGRSDDARRQPDARTQLRSTRTRGRTPQRTKASSRRIPHRTREPPQETAARSPSAGHARGRTNRKAVARLHDRAASLPVSLDRHPLPPQREVARTAWYVSGWSMSTAGRSARSPLLRATSTMPPILLTERIGIAPSIFPHRWPSCSSTWVTSPVGLPITRPATCPISPSRPALGHPVGWSLRRVELLRS